MSVNKVILIGNLGRDPEVRYSVTGTAVCNLSIATTRQRKDKNGDMTQKETEWHKVSVFGRTAEVCGEFLKKGAQVYIEGRLQTRKYDKDGVTHYSTEVVCEFMNMLGGRGEQQTQQAQAEPAPMPDDCPF